MDRVSDREGGIWREQSLSTRTHEVKIEVLQRARIAEDRPTHGCRHESDDRIPFALVVSIG